MPNRIGYIYFRKGLALSIGLPIIGGMNYEQVIEYFGSQKAAAVALSLSQPSISDWKSTGRIPHLRQLQIEHVTEGALKADELKFDSVPPTAGQPA